MKKVVRCCSAAISLVLLFLGCSSDKTQQGPSQLSKRGESCQSSGDCESGFVCVRNTCSVGSYNLQPTGKACVLVECHAPEDCCPPRSSQCDALQAECEGGFTFACDTYNQQCVCDATKFSCDDGKCTQACTPSDGGLGSYDICRSFGANFSCVGGKCVQCVADKDCSVLGAAKEMTCKDNKCQIKCVKDPDCDPFYRCDVATASCVYAGCQTNLECISKVANPLAICDNGKCNVPCKSDPECGGVATVGGINGVTAGLQVCVEGHCVDVGCDSDDQCRILNNLTGGSRITAECRAVASP